MPDLEIDKMLVVSTAHLRERTCNVWLSAEDIPLTRYQKGEYGWFVFCGDADSFQCETNGYDNADKPAEDFPNELWLVMQFAREHGCSWVTFDRDGDTVDGLVVYDW